MRHEESRKNEPALSDRLLELRLAEKNTNSRSFSARRAKDRQEFFCLLPPKAESSSLSGRPLRFVERFQILTGLLSKSDKLLSERELRAVKHIAVRRSIVSEHESAMHRQAEPGLQVSSQAGFSKEKLLGKRFSPYKTITHSAERSRNHLADRGDFLLLPGLSIEHRAVFPRVVEPPEKSSRHHQIRMPGESDPELVIARNRPPY